MILRLLRFPACCALYVMCLLSLEEAFGVSMSRPTMVWISFWVTLGVYLLVRTAKWKLNRQ